MEENIRLLKTSVAELEKLVPFSLSKFDYERWLEAGNGDTNSSIRMLRHHLKFVHAGLNHPLHTSLYEYCGWSIPGGVDKRDNVMFIHFLGAMDQKGLEKNKYISGGDFSVFQIKILLEAISVVRELEAEHQRRFGIHIVYDFKGLSLSLTELVRDTHDLFAPFCKFYDNHCKGLLRQVTLLNLPSVWTFFWPICKALMPHTFVHRCHMWSEHNIKKGLLTCFDEDQIPDFYSGGLEVGDRVSWPGKKVPQELYISSERSGISNRPLQHWVCDPGKFTLLQFEIPEESLTHDGTNSSMTLEYKLWFNMSCEFGIFHSDQKSQSDVHSMTMATPHFTPLPAARDLPEKGVLEIRSPGFYNILFDNHRAMLFRLKVTGDILIRGKNVFISSPSSVYHL